MPDEDDEVLKPMGLRLTAKQREDIGRAAAGLGMPASVYCREVLAAAAARDTARAREEKLGSGEVRRFRLEPSGCQHPPQARDRQPGGERCLLCGARKESAGGFWIWR